MYVLIVLSFCLSFFIFSLFLFFIFVCTLCTTDEMNNNNNSIERVQALADILRSALCCQRNETRAPITNPPNSAQLEGTPTISPVTPGSVQ